MDDENENNKNSFNEYYDFLVSQLSENITKFNDVKEKLNEIFGDIDDEGGQEILQEVNDIYDSLEEMAETINTEFKDITEVACESFQKAVKRKSKIQVLKKDNSKLKEELTENMKINETLTNDLEKLRADYVNIFNQNKELEQKFNDKLINL